MSKPMNITLGVFLFIVLAVIVFALLFLMYEAVTYETKCDEYTKRSYELGAVPQRCYEESNL